MKCRDRIIKYIRDNLLFLVLVSQPILDHLAYFQGGGSTSVAGYIRLIYTILIPLYTLIVIKEKKKLLTALCVIGGAAFLHILNGFRVGYINLFADVKYMLLVIHMPVLFFCFKYMYKKDETIRQLVNGLKINFIIIVLTFFVSYILKSGNYTYIAYQQGWTGWYLIPNAQSIIMASLIAFGVYFIMERFKKLFPVPMLAVIFMYVKNGTKATYWSIVLVCLGFCCFLAFEYFIKKSTKFPLYNVAMLLLMAGITVSLYNYSPRMIMDNSNETAREEEQIQLEEELLLATDDEDVLIQYIDKEMIRRFGRQKVIEIYGDNLTAYGLADVRLKKRLFGKLVWEESDFLTKLVGYEYGNIEYDDQNFDLENDPPAILYYYGYIGVSLYICFIAYFVLRLAKNLLKSFKEHINLFNFVVLITLVLQLGLAVYSGYLFRRPNVSIYLMVVLLLVYYRTDSLSRCKRK